MPGVMKEWLIDPLDTLFFRDGLPFGYGEYGFLESIFPPTPQTMQGLVRSSVLFLNKCIDLKIYGSDKCPSCDNRPNCSIPDQIGTPAEGMYGALDLYGPYLSKGGTIYYPAPLDIMREKTGNKRFFSLVPFNNGTQCDIGKIRLPAKPDKSDYGVFDMTGGWISESALKEYLEKDKCPDAPFKDDNFFEKEPRVGIAREYDTHRARDGMLYSISPLRFQENVKIGIRVGGLHDGILKAKNFVTKFGGEGKVVSVEIKDYQNNNSFKLLSNDKQIKMVLLQPSYFKKSWLPDGFNEVKDLNGAVTHWEGLIQTVKVHLVSACIGRPQKIGGWNLAGGKPTTTRIKPMRSYVPAGSVFYFEVIKGDPASLQTEGKAGENCRIGFGHYMLGRW